MKIIKNKERVIFSIMRPSEKPNVRRPYIFFYVYTYICSKSHLQEIYATSPTLFSVFLWIVTPRALCGRGAIDVKPLQGFFRRSASNKISTEETVKKHTYKVLYSHNNPSASIIAHVYRRESRRRRHISLAPRPPQRRTWGCHV
jgi:hypothetical protein